LIFTTNAWMNFLMHKQTKIKPTTITGQLRCDV
jgi:hypothetical protein